MQRRRAALAALLFGSGFCALIYQVVWQRMFRLVFGVSTGATAAVLAIFMGGLGLGSHFLGRRADRIEDPLRFYAVLEGTIAVSSALTPLLLALVRALYAALGGSVVLGGFLSTAVRLCLAALVLILPTVAMGGTLPAVARAAATEEDAARRDVALLYGANTIGAVTGSMLSTFVLLEIYGTEKTLWMACLLNLIVALAAYRLSRGPAPAAESKPEATPAARPAPFVLAAASVAGFVFFLLEIVWYRMLGPILGGTVFTFGLILAVALLGIGLGGLAYPLLFKRARISLTALASTCALEALFVALPYALGDRLALLALYLRPLGIFGFGGHVASWVVVASIVILPAALVAGIQFPLLIALLGQGRREVGRQVGALYAFNTAGAIAGALAGGFGLLPVLDALGCWRLVAWLLLGLGAAALLASASTLRPRALFAPLLAGAAAVLCLFALGPTAVWRHAGIGAGRAPLEQLGSPNKLRDWINYQRRTTVWEAEGIETSVALQNGKALSFVLNGKTDGNAIGDAGTQIFLGILGAILHPRMARAMVIGLGTGSTAGWLAQVPTAERVDVVELEPAVLEVARRCAPVNRGVLSDPKVRVLPGDAREVLSTIPETYDLIASEPSNPYRAGIASLYTADFYRASKARLRRGGVFVQWVQVYDIDTETLRSVYATLGSVFPFVETWKPAPDDILLVASAEPLDYGLDRLKERMAAEPYRSALFFAARSVAAEGLLAMFVARASFADALKQGGAINTDDENTIEFGFARSIAGARPLNAADLIRLAQKRGEDLPSGALGVDPETLLRERRALDILHGRRDAADPVTLLYAGEIDRAGEAWKRTERKAESPRDLELAIAAGLAEGGTETGALIERLAAFEPTEAEVWRSALGIRSGVLDAAADSLARAFERCRGDPWPAEHTVRFGFRLALTIAARDKGLGRRLFEALEDPFAVSALDFERKSTVLDLAAAVDFGALCARALAPFEPNPPWNERVLGERVECYRASSHPLLDRAIADLEAFHRFEPARL